MRTPPQVRAETKASKLVKEQIEFMSEAATTTVSPSVIVKPDLPAADGKAGLITMRNIWKTYDMGAEKVHALHGVSFDVRRGEYLAIIGPSGSGISTLTNLSGC